MLLRLFLFTSLIFSPFAFVFGQSPSNIEELELAARKGYFSIEQSPAGENFDVKHYRCEWYIDPRVRAIRGKVRTTFKTTKDTTSFLLFDFYNGLLVDSVVFRGQKRQSEFQGTNLFRIKLGQILPIHTTDSVSVYYHGIPNNSGFGSFNKENHGTTPIVWTMSCPYGSRDWWPNKQDLTDKCDSIDLIISTPQQYRAAGNGLLVAEWQTDSIKTYYWKHKYPIASYLIATAVTNYMAYTQYVHLPSQALGDSLPVVNFVYPESFNGAQTNTKNVLKVLSFYDSLLAPYPFRKEKYGHAQFGWGGGMEHQTMSFMTDFSFSLQAHELAHQWFGNYITCRSWRDVWLNEGFATYMTGLSEKRFGVTNFQSFLNSTQTSVKSVASGSVWVSDTNNLNRIFDSRLTYKKGAMILHTLRWVVGETAFWTGIRNYLSDNQLAYGFANSQQFFHHMEQSSGLNLSGFMADWFTGQGYPSYQVLLTKNGTDMELKLNQTSSHPSVPFFDLKVPIRFSALNQDTTLIFQHDSSGQVFNFSLNFSPTSIVFDPDKWIIAKNTVQILTDNQELIPGQQKFWAGPNPFKEILSLVNDSQQNIELTIHNAMGQAVWESSLMPGLDQSINLNHLKAGFYTLTYSVGRQRFTQKLVKE